MGKRNKKPNMDAEYYCTDGRAVCDCTEPCENETKEFDAVNCPRHYTSGKIEVIDYIEDVCGQLKDGFEGFLIGNILKYASRQDKKNGVQDVKKMLWYGERFVKYKEGKDGESE